MMLCSIREEIPKNQQKRPVALMIPVNLRNYFPSQSMTNFFGWIEVGYIFSDETTFEDVLLSVKKQFEEELVKEKIAMHMSGYVCSPRTFRFLPWAFCPVRSWYYHDKSVCLLCTTGLLRRICGTENVRHERFDHRR